MELQDRHKFKLWNKWRKHFIEPHNIAIGMWNGEPNICMPHHVEGDLEVVMCTGLKDTDGTLIYEGDILDIDGELAIVNWLNDGWKLIGDNYAGDDLFPQIRSLNGYIDLDGNEVDGKAMWGKVIGNIFENDISDFE